MRKNLGGEISFMWGANFVVILVTGMQEDLFPTLAWRQQSLTTLIQIVVHEQLA
jgi:hypothetical protein